MYLVVGLGNPGNQYEATRHNMGFDTVDRLVEDYNVPQGGVKFNAMYGKTMIGGEKVILMKPLSFMNLSGGPVRVMANYFIIDPESELIVIDPPAWHREISPYQSRSWCKAEGMGSGRSCTWQIFHRRQETCG